MMTALLYPVRPRRGRRGRLFLGFLAIAAITRGTWLVDAHGPREADQGRLTVSYVETNRPDWTSNESWNTGEPTSRWHGLSSPDGLDPSRNVLGIVRRVPMRGQPGGEQGDRAALEALYDATGGDGWTNDTNWKTDVPLSEWYGVRTDAAGRVTRLDLGDNGLTGSIPPGVRSLVNLEWLDLGFNDLTGAVPAELGSLANLRSLSLFQNALTGPIPAALGNLVNLRVLALGGNALTGPLPDALARLANLELLHVGFCDLTGPLPAWLGNLTDLRILDLRWNAFTGPLPSELASLVSLEVLALGGNDLTGPVPRWLGDLDRLRTLDVGSNALSGAVPGALGSLTNLQVLDLGVNRLTGPFPAWLENLTRLRVLRLDWNGFTGSIPAGLGNLAGLEQLHLGNSWGLSGPLPTGLREARLERLDIFLTQACAPFAWRDWLSTIEFNGRLCEAVTDATVDVAVVYTPAARLAAGGTAEIEAAIDLMIAEANEAFATSGGEPPPDAGGSVRGGVRRDGQLVARSRPSQESVGRSHGRSARAARPGRGRPGAPDRRQVRRRRPSLHPGGLQPRRSPRGRTLRA